MTFATIESRTGFYQLAKAESIASELNGYDDDWTYTVTDCENGYGRIDVIDEDGEIVIKGFML